MIAQGQVPGVDVSRETSERLLQFESLLKKWNPAINLVARSTLPTLWQRHILDSAQLFRLAPAGARHWADLGSGGGFPGLIIATLAADLNPALRVSLVEADGRKAAFLREAARVLSLANVEIHADRIESVPALQADVLSARALSALPMLCEFAVRHLAPGGIALFPKGAQHGQEIADAGRTWRFDISTFPSETDPAAVILALKAIEHV